MQRERYGNICNILTTAVHRNRTDVVKLLVASLKNGAESIVRALERDSPSMPLLDAAFFDRTEIAALLLSMPGVVDTVVNMSDVMRMTTPVGSGIQRRPAYLSLVLLTSISAAFSISSTMSVAPLHTAM